MRKVLQVNISSSGCCNTRVTMLNNGDFWLSILFHSRVFHPCRHGATFFTPAFSTPAVWCRVFHSCVFHPCSFTLLRFPPLQSDAAFSTPAFSTPAVWCRVFHSRVFHPCSLVPRFPLLRFPPLQSGAAFSTPAV